jgi:PhnB protein
MTEMNSPAGYHTITARTVVEDLDAAVAFLRACFGATGEVVPGRPVELMIGDSKLMVSDTAEREAFPAMLYIYVGDVDATYQRGLAADGEGVDEPRNMPWGDRRAILQDSQGNVFQIAQRLD